MVLIRPVLVFVVTLAGVVDGGLILGVALASSLVPSRPLSGYLATSLLLLGASIGAAPAAALAASVVVRPSRARFVPLLLLTVIAGLALALAQTWLVQNLLHQPSRIPLLLASAVLVAVVATAGAMVMRTPVPGPGRRLWVVQVAAIVAVVLLSILLLLTVYFVASAFSTFS